MHPLIHELGRRRVFRAAGVYAVVAFVVFQVGDIVVEPLRLPAWTMPLIIVVALLGFPLALVLAWAFDVTPEGVRRTRTQAGPAAAPPGRWRAAAWVSLALLVGAVGLGGHIVRGGGAPPSSDPEAAVLPLSLAVLPFADLSPDRDQEHLSDGVTEDLLTKLAGVSGLRVPSRTSVMRYKGTTRSIPEIGRELGVAYVLEGSVRRDGNRVRMTGQLIRADTDEHVWAENYDRELTDIFAVQAEIAERITEALEVTLSRIERERLARSATRDVRAYELYLKARRSMAGGAVVNLEEVERQAEEAIGWLRDALRADPRYAPGYAGLSGAFLSLAFIRSGDPAAEASYDSAVAFAARAVELDPELALGHVALSRALLARGARDEALLSLRRALALNPHDPDALGAMATVHRDAGRLADALRDARRAAALEPTVAQNHRRVALMYLDLGDLDRAEEWFRRAWQETEPHPAQLGCQLAYIALLRGQPDRVREAIRAILRDEPDGPFALGCALELSLGLRDFQGASTLLERGRAYLERVQPLDAALVELRAGDPHRAAGILRRAEEQSGVGRPWMWGSLLKYNAAGAAALRGDRDEAVRRLEDAIDDGFRLRHALEAAVWDDLRDDPRFRQLAARIAADVARMRDEVEQRQ